MLLADAEICIDEVSFCADMGIHGRIAIKPFVSPKNTFLVALTLIIGRYITVHRDVSIGKRGYPHILLFQDGEIDIADAIMESKASSQFFRSSLVKPLAQPFCGRDTLNTQGILVESFVIIKLTGSFKRWVAGT